MIIDTSAPVAILDQEPEATRTVPTLAFALERKVSARNLVEAAMVMQAQRRRPHHFSAKRRFRR
jgi:uncharacterized protein with PIN domain